MLWKCWNRVFRFQYLSQSWHFHESYFLNVFTMRIKNRSIYEYEFDIYSEFSKGYNRCMIYLQDIIGHPKVVEIKKRLR